MTPAEFACPACELIHAKWPKPFNACICGCHVAFNEIVAALLAAERERVASEVEKYTGKLRQDLIAAAIRREGA